MINRNGWAPRKYKWSTPIPITNPLIANRNGLYYNFHTYNARGVARFYYNLSLFL
ncbi:hypothetical protein MaMV-DH010172 [Cyanophage MaMV-DH01]|nr:hypothetical protein MaMV-DH010172 [Cyanophage MaMV-DH01]